MHRDLFTGIKSVTTGSQNKGKLFACNDMLAFSNQRGTQLIWPIFTIKIIQTRTCLLSSYKQSGPGLPLTAVYSEDLPGNGRFSGSFLYFSLVSLSMGDEALKEPNMSVAPGKPWPYKLFKGMQTQKDRLSVIRLFFFFSSSGDSKRRKDKGTMSDFSSIVPSTGQQR